MGVLALQEEFTSAQNASPLESARAMGTVQQAMASATQHATVVLGR
jgi:hypothetical protein